MQKLLPLLAGSILLIQLACFVPGAQAEAVRVRGTRVLIDRPAGFADAPNFSGFARPDEGASIMVTELPAPFAQTTAGFNESGLGSRGMKLLSKQETKVANLPAVFIEVSQAANGIDFRKWMLAFGDQQRTAIVTGTYPASAKALSEPIRAALLSARFDSSAPASTAFSTEDLPFIMPSSKDMKAAQRIQNSLIFTPSGKLGGTGDGTVFIVGQALSDLDIGDKEAFARRRLRQTTNIGDVQILGESDVKLAGMPGREITATAVGKKGEKLFLYQVIIYGMGSYFIMQGMTDLPLRAAREPQFRVLANSFRLK